MIHMYMYASRLIVLVFLSLNIILVLANNQDHGDMQQILAVLYGHCCFKTYPNCRVLVYNVLMPYAKTSIIAWVVLYYFSAGIGRTGTFIALNILIDQGKQLGYVDVAACVENLRRQRVNMVQNLVMY